jgi:hypothetical protein
MLNGVSGMKHPFDVAQGRLLSPYQIYTVGIPFTSFRTSLQEDLLRNKGLVLMMAVGILHLEDFVQNDNCVLLLIEQCPRCGVSQTCPEQRRRIENCRNQLYRAVSNIVCLGRGDYDDD